MNIRYLKEFLQLAKSLNYTVAADLLFMSRSTLSKHIKQLEDDLGVELFERSTKSVMLTKQGEILRKYAYNILSEYESALADLDCSRTIQGSLRVAGCARFPRIQQAMITEVSVFEGNYPDVAIIMDDIFGRDYREMLFDGTYDVVCSFRLPGLNEEGLEFIPLFEMEVGAWVPPDSDLARQKVTSYDELSEYTIRYMEPQRSRLLTSLYRSQFEQRDVPFHVGKPLTPTLHMDTDEFCLFPLVLDSADSIPDVMQVRIEDPVRLPVCWVRKHKTVNPIAPLFFEQLASSNKR